MIKFYVESIKIGYGSDAYMMHHVIRACDGLAVRHHLAYDRAMLDASKLNRAYQAIDNYKTGNVRASYIL